MTAPRSGGIPPLFWIILAGLVVLAVVAFSLYGGSRQGISANVDTPVNREIGEAPSVRPPDAMPGAAPVTAPVAPASEAGQPGPGEAPPTGGSPLPASDPDAD